MQRCAVAILLLLFSVRSFAAMEEVDFKKLFSDRDACFVIVDLESGTVISEYNGKRCKERFSPCSTFKVPAAVMAFDKRVLKDENPVIKWDGVKRDRPELNQGCMEHPDQMLGSFAGALKTKSRTYVFAANASDLKPQGPPGGPRLRKSVIEILEQMKLD